MYLTQIPDLTKDNSKRCTVWLTVEHKHYIEDLAHINGCRERDALFYIIEEYREAHPVIPLRQHE